MLGWKKPAGNLHCAGAIHTYAHTSMSVSAGGLMTGWGPGARRRVQVQRGVGVACAVRCMAQQTHGRPRHRTPRARPPFPASARTQASTSRWSADSHRPSLFPFQQLPRPTLRVRQPAPALYLVLHFTS